MTTDTPTPRERICAILDPELFCGDANREHRAASPLSVVAAQARIFVKADAILNAGVGEEAGEVLDDPWRLPHGRRRLYELLAVIHRDGGHYTAQHGIAASVAAAIKISSERIAELATPSPGIDLAEVRERLVEAITGAQLTAFSAGRGSTRRDEVSAVTEFFRKRAQAIAALDNIGDGGGR